MAMESTEKKKKKMHHESGKWKICKTQWWYVLYEQAEKALERSVNS